MLEHLKSTLSSFFANSRGQLVGSKLLIFESDDWGAIRTPSKSAVESLKLKGLDFSKSNYVVDKLEDSEDLDLLFNVLVKFKDKTGNHPKFTANSVMYNPDFGRIKEDHFELFYKRTFIQTYSDYFGDDRTWNKFKLGVESKLFKPQFHGREHINVNRWLSQLKKGNSSVLNTFDVGCTFSGEGDYSFMEALDWDNVNELNKQHDALKEGLDFFHSTFGFRSNSFIAPCYIWDSRIEDILKSNGVDWLQGIRKQIIPMGKYGMYNYKLRKFGEVSESGLKNNIRNCFFEPAFDPNIDWVNSCLAQINMAFLMKKPAVISSHRINFIGGISENNRAIGLRQLELLLKKVLQKFPDLQFISTDELDNFI
jgi:hypothetical protein